MNDSPQDSAAIIGTTVGSVFEGIDAALICLQRAKATTDLLVTLRDVVRSNHPGTNDGLGLFDSTVPDVLCGVIHELDQAESLLEAAIKCNAAQKRLSC